MRRTRLGLAAVVLAAAIAALALVVSVREEGSPGHSVMIAHAPLTTPGTPSRSTTPPPAPVTATAGRGGPPVAGPTRSAARAALSSPTAPYDVPANIDGCDHNYGGQGQCVPWTFPAGVTARCGWLRARGYGFLVVVGEDRQRLDSNHDGVACGPGDR